ncbi:unnamed protein product [Cladocopium goreaui]|uniref:EF-hand domain-containing protein n=1 Tax=Cladocopium goreaui TaxID=2562237 RepID=A0A9P1GLZ7_9DINO|nr:unnamed protein product [Cladocopium goreaui]
MAPWLRRRQIRGTEHLSQAKDEGILEDFLKLRAGSLLATMHTLFGSITGGFTWIEARDAFDEISIIYGFLFEVYIAFCNFAVLNVMTGVFCQSAIESAEKDHELNLESVQSEKEKYFRAVRRLFTQLDENSDGGITKKEFERAWSDPVLQTVFDALEISSTDAWDLFRQLDRDGSGEVDVDEFLEGCMMIKGPARSIDVVCIKKATAIATLLAFHNDGRDDKHQTPMRRVVERRRRRFDKTAVSRKSSLGSQNLLFSAIAATDLRCVFCWGDKAVEVDSQIAVPSNLRAAAEVARPVRGNRCQETIRRSVAGHPDWLPVLLDEQGQQEPFLLDDLPGKQAAQKGRNNKKQILAPGALRPGSQVPGLSDLLEGARVGVAGKKNANAKTLQGAAKSKNTNKNKQPKGPDVVPHPMVAAFPQMQMQWLQAMATGCGVPMPMMAPGGLPMQGFMQPAMYDGVDSNVLMGMNMMPFPGGVDMSQYMNIAAFGQSYPYGNGDAFEQFGDIRGNENAEDEEGDVEEEDDPAMTPSYIVSGQPLG